MQKLSARTLTTLAGSALLATTLAACAPQEQQNTQAEGTTTCDYPSDGQQAAKPVDPPPSSDVPNVGETTVTITTNSGDIAVTMDRAKAPCAINSFVSLAKQGYYDGTQCHRLTTEGIYVLQCGDPTATGTGGPGYQFADEEGGDYTAGTVAMANAGPNTNGSQFFLVYEDSPLPPDYTILGTMDDAGTEVVTEIAAEGNDAANGPGDGKPNNEVQITKVAAQ